MATRELDPTERAILEMERRTYRHAGAREQAIVAELGMTPTRYYQMLNRLLDDEAALAHDPVTVHRLRRLRDSRQRTRPWQRLTTPG